MKRKFYKEFEEVLAKNSGICYFYIYNKDLCDDIDRLQIIRSLSKVYKASQLDVKRYLDKLIKNLEPCGHTVILNNVSRNSCEALAKELEDEPISFGYNYI